MKNSVRTVAVDDVTHDVSMKRLLYSLVGSGIDDAIIVEVRLNHV